MKLHEIRDAYLSTFFDSEDATTELCRRSIPQGAAQELLDLWVSDEQHQAEQRQAYETARPKHLSFSQALGLIDDAYTKRIIDSADAAELLTAIGIKDDSINEHLYVLDTIARSGDLSWQYTQEAPDWIRQLSNLVRMFLQGDISARNVMLQLDPKDNYPHVVGAILAHLCDTRDNLEELTGRARSHPEQIADGIEYCRKCGRARPSRELSRRGLCHICSAEIHAHCMNDLMNHSGPYYRRWRDGMLKAMYLLEDEIIAERPDHDSGLPTPPIERLERLQDQTFD